MMWDFSNGNQAQEQQVAQTHQHQHHHRSRRHSHSHSHSRKQGHKSPQISMPSPSMPVAQTPSASDPYGQHASSSYPGFLTPQLTSPPPINFPMEPRAVTPQPQPATQVIHVLNYSYQQSSHKHRRHRKHSTHTVTMPPPMGHSNSYGPPVTFPHPQAPTQIQTHTQSHSYSYPNPQYPSFPIPIQPSYSHPPAPTKPPKPSKPPKAPTIVSKPSDLGLNAHFQYSKCTGRKKALCIGINYHGQPNELRGCINDARHVQEFLIRYHGYRSRDIVLLTDDSTNPRELPTKKNILDAMHWLVRSARTNDSLFFHYSGHGGQIQDLNGDEVDGWDEVIFPMDFKTNGHILDDTMHDIMVKPLPTGCRLTALFDSCHSGTVLDLPYIYSSHGRLKGRHVSDRYRKAKDTGADAISWSACKDGQTSADTFADGKAVGAMSHAFIKALKDRPSQSYQELLRAIRLNLYAKYTQKPQLGSSHPIDTTLQFVI